MSFCDSYILHPLNVSSSKETHIFPKEERFGRSKRFVTEAIYNLPSTKTRRATTFGYGNKISLENKSSSPPPCKYQLPSDFERSTFFNTPTIAHGRDKVCFGSFLLETLKRNKHVPSPDRYQISSPKDRTGGNMGTKLALDYSQKEKKAVPGPGSYQTNATDFGQSSYMLSTFKNSSSPRFYTESKPKHEQKTRDSFSSACYDIQEKKVGLYSNSKYRSVATRTFSKARRPGLCNQHELTTPGFKYHRFSEFGP